MAVITAGALVAHAQTDQDAALKAAFLLNFTKFIQWPPEVMQSPRPFIACVMGSAAVAESLANSQTRFAINVDAASRARLQISSRLMALASIVREQP